MRTAYVHTIFRSARINKRTNGPVNAHLRSAAYTNKRLNIMVFNPSAGADEALGPFSPFFQNNQYSDPWVKVITGS